MRKTVVAKSLVVFLSIAAPAMAAFSQERKESSEAHKIVRFGDLKWAPIIKGCDLAPVAGDMDAEAAPFVLRIRCADESKIPAHWHPTDENVTVLKGTFLVGRGESFDGKQTANDECGKFFDGTKGDAALCHEQGRDHRPGPCHGAVQSKREPGCKFLKFEA